MADLKLVKQNVALFSVLLVMAIIAFVLNLQIAEANKAASEAEKTRELSLQLVDELRQSSDDLTRMARLYVVTGDSTYIQYFNEVIAIREGKQLRPIDYHEIYWDFVLADGKKPRPGSEKTPMVELVKEYIESAEALEYFVKAKSSSDDLILIEEEAFNAVKGLFKDSLNTYSIQSVPDLDYASKLLHGEDYLKAKAKIMLSIQDFSHFVSQSTNSSINEIKSGLTRLSFLLIVVVLVAIVVLIVVVFTNLRHLLGSRKKQEKPLSTDKISLIGILHEMERSWVVVLLSFVFSVLVFAFLYYANTSIKENIEKSLKESLVTVNQTTNKNLENWLLDLENGIELVASNPTINTNLLRKIAGNEEEIEIDLDKEIEKHIVQDSYVGFLVLDKEGRVVYSTNEDWNEGVLSTLENGERAKTILANTDLVFSFPCKKGGYEVYNNSIKVGKSLASKDGESTGHLILLFDPAVRFTDVLHQGRLGNSGESYAFNDQGVMISESRFNNQLIEIGMLEPGQSSELNIHLKVPNEEGGDAEMAYTYMANDALKGYAGVNVSGYKDYRGIKVVGTWNWFEKYGFGTATEIDYDEAFRTYLLVNKLGYYGGGLFVLLIVVLTLVFIFNRLKLSRLNAAMERQKVLLENTIESLPHPFYVIKTSDYSLLLANEAAKKLSKTNLTTCYALTHKRDSPCNSVNDPCPLKIVRETKQPVVVEHTHFDKNGEKIFAEVHGYPVFNEAGEVEHMIEYSLDITERKLAEKVLSDERQRFKQLLESTPDAIIIIGENGRIQVVNNKMLKLFGYTKSEVIGQPLEILIPNEIGEKHISHRKNFFKNPSSRNMGERNDLFAVRKDKSRFPVEISLNPIETTEGVLVASAIRDITERKEAEERIKASENKFRSIASTASDAIISTGQNGLIESWNKAAVDIFGYTEEEAIGKPMQLFIPEEYHDAHIKGMQRVVDGGEKKVIGRTVELKAKKKDGSIFPIDLALSSWVDQGQMKFSGIIRDVTERKKYEEAIEQANKRMSSELNVAKDIQMSMLPLIFPAFPKRKEIDVYADLLPAREVGGDFYDFFFIDDDHFAFVVGDVSGKGVPAALMMAVCKTLIKSNSRKVHSTAKILTWVNNEMAKENINSMFVTVFMAILNTKTGEMTYTNAGHNPTYIKKADGSVNKLSDLHGVVIAAMEGLTYKESKVQLGFNDFVFAYTDGIPEAHNSKDEMYSDQKLLDLLKEHTVTTPRDMIDEVVSSVREFEAGFESFDDITALCVHYRKKQHKQ